MRQRRIGADARFANKVFGAVQIGGKVGDFISVKADFKTTQKIGKSGGRIAVVEKMFFTALQILFLKGFAAHADAGGFQTAVFQEMVQFLFFHGAGCL